MDGPNERSTGGVVDPAELAFQEAQQTMHYINQVEAIVAAGPRGQLETYLQVVDLLFPAKALLERAKFNDGVLQTKQLLATAMDDLEAEFRDMLKRRSEQTAARLTKDDLKKLYASKKEDEREAPPEQRIGEQVRQTAAESPTPEEGIASEFLPPPTVRWLHHIAKRMRTGGAAARCCEVYRLVRSEFVESCLKTMKTDLVCSLSVESMTWEYLEMACKEWILQVNVLVEVLLVSEYELCKQVLDGLGADQGRAFAEMVRGVALKPTLDLLRVGRAIAAKRLPEQLFAMLDMFATVEELDEPVQQVFCGPGCEEVQAELQGMPRLLAGAVLATFDQFRKMLQDSSAAADANARRKIAIPSFLKLGQGNEVDNDLVPRGGVVHPITSYVVNYIRVYLHRLGKRNYVKILERVFEEFGSQPGETPKSVDRETASLVMALRKYLEVKARLYKEEALTQLFLMNNINYLFRSMLLWHGWHGRGLLRALSAAQREGPREILLALTDLQDDRIVSHYSTQFQKAALAKVVAVLGDPAVDGRKGPPPVASSLADLKNKLKKFNLAFGELCVKQEEWVVPDDELRTRIRGQWATLIKERYRKMLIPHWDELTQSSHYAYRPEDIEMKIMKFFVPNRS